MPLYKLLSGGDFTGIEGLGHFESISKPDPDDGEVEGSVEVDDDSFDAAGSASNEGFRPVIREQVFPFCLQFSSIIFKILLIC